MQIIKKLIDSTTPLNFIPLILLLLLLFLPFVGCSSHEHVENSNNNNGIKNNHQVSHQMRSDITVHGLLLWASIGFLMPIGILTIRMSIRDECRRCFKLLFYFHPILQTFSVLLATAGAILSLRSFDNSFNNHHQRIGLALYGAVWLQVFIGFRRPKRGSKGRSLWYFLHWVLGTTICVVGIFNIYTGLESYHKRTTRSTRLWATLFTAQIFSMAIFYLFQDKWEHMMTMQGEGAVINFGVGNDQLPVTTPEPSGDHQLVPQRDTHKEKEEVTEQSRRKANSLGNYFARSIALKKLFQLT